jgi:superoxide dismutase
MNDECYVCIDTLSVLSKIDTVFVVVAEKFTELLRDKILTQYGSLEAFNKKVTHMERQAFAWAFKAKNGHQLDVLPGLKARPSGDPSAFASGLGFPQ